MHVNTNQQRNSFWRSFINYLKFLKFLASLEISWGTEGWRVHHKKLVETAYGPTFNKAVKNLLIRLREYKQMLEEKEPRLSNALHNELDYLRMLWPIVEENTSE